MSGSLVNFSQWLRRLGFTQAAEPEFLQSVQPVQLVQDGSALASLVVPPTALIGFEIATPQTGQHQTAILEVLEDALVDGHWSGGCRWFVEFPGVTDPLPNARAAQPTTQEPARSRLTAGSRPQLYDDKSLGDASFGGSHIPEMFCPAGSRAIFQTTQADATAVQVGWIRVREYPGPRGS